MPMILRRSSALSGMRDEAGSRKVYGPGSERLRMRNAALSTRQYAAASAISANTAEKVVSLLPLMRRMRSIALGERIEQPNA